MSETVLSSDAFLHKLDDAFRAKTAFPLTVTGQSMLPFLAPGRDVVFLSPPEKISVGSIVLVQDEFNKPVLHRVLKKRKHRIWIAGDAQTALQGPVPETKVIAQCRSAKRKGAVITPADPVWWFYAHVWRYAGSLRPRLIETVGRFKRE